MQSFKKIKTMITPLDKVNVDTDQIVPKQFLKLVQKSGFGKFLFYNWRYDDQEHLKFDIILDDKTVEKLQQETGEIEVDLENQIIKTSSEEISFAIDLHKKKILLEGLDDIAQTLLYEKKISEFEKQSKIPSVL